MRGDNGDASVRAAVSMGEFRVREVQRRSCSEGIDSKANLKRARGNHHTGSKRRKWARNSFKTLGCFPIAQMHRLNT